MKKLSKAEAKKIKGGQPPLCVKICDTEYKYCVASGIPSAQCRVMRQVCIYCECDNLCA
jgi:hypothetical protein